MSRKLWLGVMALLSSLPIWAGGATALDSLWAPVSHGFNFEIGLQKLKHSYLSPEVYRGRTYALSYQYRRLPTKAHGQWKSGIDVRFLYGHLLDRNQSNLMHESMIDFRYAYLNQRRLQYCNREFFLGFGPMITMQAGAYFLPVNSNNITAIQAFTAFGIRGELYLPLGQTHHWGNFFLQYDIPLIGAFYAPDYAQSYYEIYVGNRNGLVHFYYPGNRFDTNLALMYEFRIGSINLRAGLRSEYVYSNFNQIIHHGFTNSIVLGIGGHSIGIR